MRRLLITLNTLAILLGLFLLDAYAEQISVVLDWNDQLSHRQNGIVDNVPGENGEAMQVWTWQFEQGECFIWQGSLVYEINGVASSTHYSSTGGAALSWDDLDYPALDPTEGYYVLLQVERKFVGEYFLTPHPTGTYRDYQVATAWAVVWIPAWSTVQVGDLDWTLTD